MRDCGTLRCVFVCFCAMLYVVFNKQKSVGMKQDCSGGHYRQQRGKTQLQSVFNNLATQKLIQVSTEKIKRLKEHTFGCI